jgi:type II secretory ATPase GspE/PulE/Tfp pilus assembly ATPase PilB-like protein
VGLSSLLNEEQRAAYDEIMSKVDTEQGGLFFVDGPGGTGKTFCIEHFSELFAVRTKLPLLLLHLV